jgi:hypothetical protein
MNTHLLETKSYDVLTSQIGLNKLNLCMMVLSNIQATYSSATFIRGLFLEAIETLNARRTVEASSIYDDIDSGIGSTGIQNFGDDIWMSEEWQSGLWDPTNTFPVELDEKYVYTPR